MHWIKLNDERFPFLNLSDVVSVDLSDHSGIKLWYVGEDFTFIVGAENRATILARLNALAEIATHRTTASLPALAEETE
jgi:hypothetical protein